MTVEELDDRMSSAEFTRWIAYAGIEPFGYPIDNYRFGISTQEIVNSVRSTIPVPKGGKRPPMLRAEQLYPTTKKADQQQLTDAQQEFLRKKRGKRRNRKR
jgi:hypothetical protein